MKEVNLLLKMADRLTPMTLFERKRLENVYDIPSQKISIIPNGINEVFFNEVIDDVQIPFKDYLLIVGRIEQNKNQLSVIKAANLIGMNLIIVGEPVTSSIEYASQCKRIAGPNVFFWGKEKNPYALKKLYSQASVTVIASYSEMLPLVIYESFSAGTPVVCTNKASIFGDMIYGLTFTAPNDRELCKSIRKAVSTDYDLNKLKLSALHWGDIADLYISVYNELEIK